MTPVEELHVKVHIVMNIKLQMVLPLPTLAWLPCAFRQLSGGKS
jgi:hypothetical protein